MYGYYTIYENISNYCIVTVLLCTLSLPKLYQLELGPPFSSKSTNWSNLHWKFKMIFDVKSNSKVFLVVWPHLVEKVHLPTSVPTSTGNWLWPCSMVSIYDVMWHYNVRLLNKYHVYLYRTNTCTYEHK